MTGNWQRPALLRKAEEHFLVGSGVFAGMVKHLALTDQEQLTVEAISAEALTTLEIEGEILDRASVQSSIRRQLGLETGQARDCEDDGRSVTRDTSPGFL